MLISTCNENDQKGRGRRGRRGPIKNYAMFALLEQTGAKSLD